MATITVTVPDATLDRLTRYAATRGVTVEQVVVPILDSAVPPPSVEDRLRALDEWDRLIQARADRYPPGFRVADDRDDFYPDRADDEP